MMASVFKDSFELHTIAVVGAGALGSRHLQALSRCEFPVQLEVYDVSEASLALARARFAEMLPNPNVRKVVFTSDIHKISTTVDLVILATNSDVRLSVLKTLLQHTKVRSVLFEKVLVQSTAELDELNELLVVHHIEAYVNCPRRSYPSTHFILGQIATDEALTLTVEGENWGLACNAIHFIDVMSVLCARNDYHLDLSRLDPLPISSKRNGFIEFTGEIEATFASNQRLCLISRPGLTPSFDIEISTARTKFRLDEKNSQIIVMDANRKVINTVKAQVPRQSELTHHVAWQIFSRQPVNLPSFSVSSDLHRPLLRELLNFYNRVAGQTASRLPVT